MQDCLYNTFNIASFEIGLYISDEYDQRIQDENFNSNRVQTIHCIYIVSTWVPESCESFVEFFLYF